MRACHSLQKLLFCVVVSIPMVVPVQAIIWGFGLTKGHASCLWAVIYPCHMKGDWSKQHSLALGCPLSMHHPADG